MKKLLVFIGESGSGKTTLIAKLTEKYPENFKKVVTCTDRSRRIGEVNGVDYCFSPTEYFIDNPSLVLVNKSDEGFYYGTKKADLFSDTHDMLLTLRLIGIRKLISLGLKNIVVVQIFVSEELKIERMRQRGDTEEMILDRLKSDIKRSEDLDLGQIPIICLYANQTIDDNANIVYEAC